MTSVRIKGSTYTDIQELPLSDLYHLYGKILEEMSSHAELCSGADEEQQYIVYGYMTNTSKLIAALIADKK